MKARGGINANRQAFLAMISFAEGTDRAPDPYRVTYSYSHTIVDLREHPAITGEWSGERLPDAMCKGAGLKPGCVSTAAGRYQIIKPTWVEAREALKLKDFGPESQDAAALWLIANRAVARGALNDIDAGRIGTAVSKCRRIWASLPGAGYAGQKERSLTHLLQVYAGAGGSLTPFTRTA